ncbi:MAG: MotA/TolQ/ExbB proton channel family protein [Planctomycetota bacterium]|nr:MotA/TolQ/ExbB proton channel family protein [Planctomycetota bacterium]
MKQHQPSNSFQILILFILISFPSCGLYAEATSEVQPNAGDQTGELAVGRLAERAVLVILGVCGVLVVLVSMERALATKRSRRRTKKILVDMAPAVETGEIDTLKSACSGNQSSLAKVLHYLLSLEKELRPDQTLLLLRNKVKEEGDQLKKFLSILATLAGTAPFIGLFGTVLGILETFAAIGRSGFSNPAAISAGISQALVATAAGLAVAIPAVILYNYFVRRANHTVDEAERKATEVLILFGRM